MRLRMKKLLVFSLGCATMLATLGCAAASEADEYVGTWVFESVINGEGIQDEESTEFISSLGVSEEVSIEADGTGTAHLFGESLDFTWERDGETREVTMVLEGEETAMQIVDGKLRLEGQREDGGTGYFVFAPSVGDGDIGPAADGSTSVEDE